MSATLTEFKEFLKVTKTDQDTWLTTVLAASKIYVQRYIGLDMTVEAAAVKTLNGKGTYFVVLTSPLTSLASLTIEGIAQTAGDFYIEDEAYLIKKDELPVFVPGYDNIAITGDWGYATWPEDLHVATLQLGAWIYQKDHKSISDAGKTYRDYTVEYIQEIPQPIAIMLNDYKVRAL